MKFLKDSFGNQRCVLRAFFVYVVTCIPTVLGSKLKELHLSLFYQYHPLIGEQRKLAG